MGIEAKKHHFVPQSILRNFSIGGRRKSIFVYDKTTMQSFESSILNAGSENDFYQINIGGENRNFEPFFQDLDARLAVLVSKVVQSESLETLSIEERKDLAVVTVCQLLRTKLQRTSPVELAREMAQRFREMGADLPGDLSEGAARSISFQNLLQMEAYAEHLVSKDLFLIVSPDAGLLISDNPVTLHNTFPYGSTGLSSPGVEIYHPISPRLCLAYFCPSIKEILEESLDPQHPRPETRDPLLDQLRMSLRGDTPLRVDPNYSQYLNVLQIRQSSRFLYSGVGQFDQVGEILSDQPHLRQILSLMTVGQVGSAPPKNPRMPPGSWLVIENKHRHHMLPVETIDEGSWTIDFTTTDHLKLAALELEAPFDCVTLYENGQETRLLRGAKFCHVENAGRLFVRVQHSDEGLNDLMRRRDPSHG